MSIDLEWYQRDAVPIALVLTATEGAE